MNRITTRRAIKTHKCGPCHRDIEPGEVYLENVISPEHDDLGNPGWWRMAECAGCATRYGRGHLVGAS